MPNVANTQITEARETYLTLLELSRLLNTGLDPETLTICVRLCEAGVNPETLATVIRELRKEVANLNDVEKTVDDANP
ncbi:mitotic-spindle organizing protein 1 [Holotrichia oblita]|uniref:Mitotic-spindle organizing protein 1 n=1 Tax=Holotrichia oblita TaxID=644536 RepID=A0ACB9SZ96_HOLOL|nr:mitotic-spindle organizing protein 1 [Holotrichia oblita]